MVTIDRLKDIVRKASKLMLTDVFEIKSKDGFTNIVTSSDVAVQKFLCQALAQEMPGCGFLCEEEDVNNIGQEYVWIIDPIDGTANYSRGIDQCAICVGLRHMTHYATDDASVAETDGEMMMGVVYLPRTNEMFWAEKGRGAYLNDRQIHVSDRPFADGVMCTALPVYHKEYADVCARIIKDVFMECNDIRRLGACAPELCYLAMGRFDMYFEYLLSPWDFAAASLIVEEAGGCIVDLAGLPLTCTQPKGVLAANSKESLDRLQEIVQLRIF